MSIHNKPQDREPGIKVHNSMIVLVGFLVGITVLFLTLTVAYLFSSPNWQWKQFAFPKLFLISAIVIAASSFSLHYAVNKFDVNQRKQHLRGLGITLALSLVFMLCQLLGWTELYQSGIYIAGKPDGSYLYLISGLHALHVALGVLLLIWMYFRVKKLSADPAQSLIYFTDPQELHKLKMLALYWHFVDLLWIYLLIFFLFNHL